MATTKKSGIFDFIIMGNNWAGWPLGLALSKQGLNIAIIGSNKHWGASLELFDSPQAADIYPDTDLTRLSLQWLSDLVGTEVFRPSEIEAQRITWNNKQWVPFMGFSKTKAASVEYLNSFNQPSFLNMTQPITFWQKSIMDQFVGTYIDPSELTGIELNEDQVTSIIINGSRKIKAHNYLYCDSPKNLLKQISREYFIGASPQKISKLQTMTRLLLILKWNQSEDNTDKGYELESPHPHPSLYFFPGAKDHEPFVGHFLTNHPSLITSWQSFIPDRLAENPENLGSQLRYIKRQLKRPFTKWFDQPFDEKIIVEPESHGHVNLRHKLTSLKNLWQSSPLTQTSDGAVGGLAAARSLYNEIGPIIHQLAPSA